MIRGASGPMWIGLIAAATVAGAAVDGRAAGGSVERGREIATVACADCHAIGRTGDSPRAEAPRFRELGRKYPVESLEEALAEGVVVGHPGMPQVKMSEADIGAFLAYLASIQVP